MNTNIDWANYIGLVLRSTPFMALATTGADGLWNNAVHYAFDSDLNIYFMSQLTSRHMAHIRANPQVALAIYTTMQPALGDVVGLQMKGLATVVAENDIPAVHQIYYSRPEFAEAADQPDRYEGPDVPWRFVRVTPSEIAYFDSRQFGVSSQIVPTGVKL